MNVKTSNYYEILYTSIVMNVKNQQLLKDPYVSITYLEMTLWNL